MYADMGLSQNRNAGNATVGSEMMQVDVQQCRATRADALPEGGFHEFYIVELIGTPEVDQKMGARKDKAVAMNKMVCRGRTFLVYEGRPFILVSTVTERADRLFKGDYFGHVPFPKKWAISS